MLKKISICLCFLFSHVYGSAQFELFTVGWGILKPHKPRPALFMEYKSILPKFPRIRPQIGVLTDDFDSVYVYAGLGLDLYWQNFVFTPSFSPGIYFQNHGLNLGFPIEFRSSVEIAYVLQNHARVGLEFFHLSNAHLSHKNPGVNAACFFVSIPFGRPR